MYGNSFNACLISLSWNSGYPSPSLPFTNLGNEHEHIWYIQLYKRLYYIAH